MAKVPPRRIDCGSYAVDVDGVTYHPHEGEWIEMVGSITVADQMAFAGLARIGVALQSIEGEPDEAIRSVELLEKYYDQVCESLARRIVAWSWTDDSGDPLPNPNKQPQMIKQLSSEELKYLIGLSRGETAADRKNVWRHSPTTSLDTGSPVTTGTPSTTGHSLQRVS